MLRFESVFWASKDPAKTADLLTKLGLSSAPSLRDDGAKTFYFGPDAIRVVGLDTKLNTLTRPPKAEGIYGLALESDDIKEDYALLQDRFKGLDKPSQAVTAKDKTPVWSGVNLPHGSTPGLATWAFANAPNRLENQAAVKLPKTHPNTCFGIESIQLLSNTPDTVIEGWQKALNIQPSGLKWNEVFESHGFRFQAGDRFLDIIAPSLGFEEGVFMLSLRVVDLEYAKDIAQKAGAETQSCRSRDGFIVPSSFTGGPALRFLRSYWKPYHPPVVSNYPNGRRTDEFRPLGGAHSTTLVEDFTPNWNWD